MRETDHHLRACGRANETGSTDRAADVSEPVSAAGRALGHYGPDAPGGARRTPRPGLRRPGGGQEAGQPLTAPRHRSGGAYLLVPLDFLRRLAAWPVRYLIVTDQRMVLTGGLLIRTAAFMPLEKVTGLTLQRTMLGRLLGTARSSSPPGADVRRFARSDTCPIQNSCTWRYPACSSRRSRTTP